jgi:hypothetical protein
MADERIQVSIEAITDQFNRGIDSVVQRLGGPGALAVAGAAAAASAAIAAFTVKSLRSFSELETGMAEVFTLMPGMTDEAMRDMTEDVQAFARETGTLTDDVVPALYDSISAGVPRENVFGFLETANMLAVGGVTTLNTAVDGLTSSVNAYGEDILSAQNASDIMFTAVKNGKTTVDELAGTLGRVTPTAAAIGVSFEEVNAAIATTTALGIKTSESVSGLKAALSNILKPTEAMLGTFKRFVPALIESGRVTGETADQFMAVRGYAEELGLEMARMKAAGEDNTTAYKDAEAQMEEYERQMSDLLKTMGPSIIESEGLAGTLALIEENAAGGRDGLGQVFGSVEALNTVLALTSEDGAAAFDGSLVEMQNSSGATEAAFETMEDTLGRNWAKIQARAQSAVQDFGQTLAPIANEILKGVIAAMDGMSATVETVSTAVTGFFRGMTDDMNLNAGGLLATVGPLFEALRDLVVAVFQRLVEVWQNDLKPAWEAIEPLVGLVFNQVTVAIETAVGTITNVLNLVSALLRGDWSAAWEAMKAQVETITNAVQSSVENAWNAMLGVMERVAPSMTASVRGAFDTMSRNITEAVENDRTAISGAWDGITALAEEKWPATTAVLTGAFNTMSTMIEEAVENDRSFISGVWDGIERILGEIWGRISDQARATFDAIRANIENAFNGLTDWVANIFGEIVSEIGGLVDSVVGRIQAAWDRVTGIFNRASEAEEAADAAREAAEAAAAATAAAGTSASSGGSSAGGGGSADFNGPHMAAGGIVTSPTYALIGEAGAEAVIPLDRLDRLMAGGSQTIIVELDGRQITRAVAPRMVSDLRLRTGLEGV